MVSLTTLRLVLREFNETDFDARAHRIAVLCDIENHASYRVMEKNGMHREGVLRGNTNIRGKWRNSYVYSVLVHEWMK